MTPTEALTILESAAEQCKEDKVQTEEVRQALRALLRFKGAKPFLINFWEAAGASTPVGRSQGTRASLNGIRRQLRPSQ